MKEEEGGLETSCNQQILVLFKKKKMGKVLKWHGPLRKAPSVHSCATEKSGETPKQQHLHPVSTHKWSSPVLTQCNCLSLGWAWWDEPFGFQTSEPFAVK